MGQESGVAFLPHSFGEQLSLLISVYSEGGYWNGPKGKKCPLSGIER
jgi:hypothetical protein